MQQVLFNIPVLKGWMDPAGLPIASFGVMLFLAFTIGTYWGVRRGGAAGMSATQIQDMFLWVVLGGLVGARLLYMYQFANQFPDKSPLALVGAFFQIWRGGLVFYGSAFGGVAAYGFFYWLVLRRLRVNIWALADGVAPVLALGLALGRIGCYLNGCCWGQVAVEEVAPVPLGGAHFPLLPAHCRDQLVRDESLQTSTGFALYARERGPGADPRARVLLVEPGSPAAAAGVKVDDRIIRVNGQPNGVLVEVTGDRADEAAAALAKYRGEVTPASATRSTTVYFAEFEDYLQAVTAVPPAGVRYAESDALGELAREWPRGRHELELTVRRATDVVDLAPFVPRSVGLYPTQLYETVTTTLLIFFLLAYHPFRRHDGQLMVLLMLFYAAHRFVNESLRVEPTYALGLTLSQWVSVVLFAAGLGVEAYLWRTKPSRWKPQPLPPPEVAPTATA